MKINIMEDLLWINSEDKCVIYCFASALESDADFLTDEEIESIILGGTDDLQDEYHLLNRQRKERVTSRVNKLLDAFHAGKVVY